MSVDPFQHGEVFAVKGGGGQGVVEFVLTKRADLIWVLCKEHEAWCDPFGGEPSEKQGIPCEPGVPVPITVRKEPGTSIKVWQPAGTLVYCWTYGAD